MAVFVAAGFVRNLDNSSQLGFIVTLRDKNNLFNVVHYGSVKSKRVTRRFLVSKLFSIVDCFDVASTIRLAVNDVRGQQIAFHLFTDSRGLLY